MFQNSYQHRPQIAQANLCVINVEKGAAENGVTLWSIFSRNGTPIAKAIWGITFILGFGLFSRANSWREAKNPPFSVLLDGWKMR